jgi:hypothetical protein
MFLNLDWGRVTATRIPQIAGNRAGWPHRGSAPPPSRAGETQSESMIPCRDTCSTNGRAKGMAAALSLRRGRFHIRGIGRSYATRPVEYLRIRMRPINETTALITGATDGRGRGVAERLAADGADLHLHGRDPERLASTAEAIKAETGNERIQTHLADLASLDDVRALADDVEASTEQLHLLISNAGSVPASPRRQAARRAATGTSCASRSTTWPAFCSPCGCCPCCGARRRRGSSTWRRWARRRSTSTT